MRALGVSRRSKALACASFALAYACRVEAGAFSERSPWYTVPVKTTPKLEAPREETRKKMRPVRREEFTALVQKAIETPSKKSSSKPTRARNQRHEKE